MRNGNISITGLTPEMFESATDPILKCSNLYKTLCNTIIKLKEMYHHDDIVKVLMLMKCNYYRQTPLVKILIFFFLDIHICCI